MGLAVRQLDMYIYIYIYIYILALDLSLYSDRGHAAGPIVQWIRSLSGSGQPKVRISGSGQPKVRSVCLVGRIGLGSEVGQ